MKNEKKWNYTYCLTNTETEMMYIGVHSHDTHPDEDSYFGSSRYVDEALLETPMELWVKTIINTFDTREEAMLDEIELHDLYDVAANPDFYNKAKATSTGFTTSGTTLSEATRAKMSAANKGRTPSEATRAKMSAAGKGRVFSEATRAKVSAGKARANQVSIPDGVFTNVIEACEFYGVSRTTISNWCRDKPDFFYIP